VPDVAFMRDMQVHHQQALAMTAMVEARTDHATSACSCSAWTSRRTASSSSSSGCSPSTRRRVERTGGDPAGHTGHSADGDHGDMPGMLTDAQLGTLEAARGDDFVRLFLEAMTLHHEGALAMAAEVFAAEGALADPRLGGRAGSCGPRGGGGPWGGSDRGA
jgi:uncharacterized protein (DUF305 family)